MTEREPGATPFIAGLEAAVRGESAQWNPYPVEAGYGPDWNAWNRGHGLACRMIEAGRTAGNQPRAGPGDSDNAKSSVQTGQSQQQDEPQAEGGP